MLVRQKNKSSGDFNNVWHYLSLTHVQTPSKSQIILRHVPEQAAKALLSAKAALSDIGMSLRFTLQKISNVRSPTIYLLFLRAKVLCLQFLISRSHTVHTANEDFLRNDTFVGLVDLARFSKSRSYRMR